MMYFIIDFSELLVVFIFFFFKQKTAYEMRISDWSSDVCSSDLMDGAPLRAGMPVAEGSTITTSANGFVTLQLADGTKVTLPQDGTTHLERQIGRASCRERVCQYV